jgi:hypothetical protein
MQSTAASWQGRHRLVVQHATDVPTSLKTLALRLLANNVSRIEAHSDRVTIQPSSYPTTPVTDRLRRCRCLACWDAVKHKAVAGPLYTQVEAANVLSLKTSICPAFRKALSAAGLGVDECGGGSDVIFWTGTLFADTTAM